MELSVLKVDGRVSQAKVKLPKHVFGIEPNEHAVYLAVKVFRANNRQGTVATKGRSDVSGGGRKPWKQKGRGAARAGSSRSPVWVGGGRVFGPQPRDYGLRLPKKVKTLARLSIYTDKAKNGQVKVVEDFKLKEVKTKEIAQMLKALDVSNDKTLLILSEYDQDVVRAGKNIPNLNIKVATTESAYDLLDCKHLLVQKGAVDKLSGAFKS